MSFRMGRIFRNNLRLSKRAIEMQRLGTSRLTFFSPRGHPSTTIFRRQHSLRKHSLPSHTSQELQPPPSTDGPNLYTYPICVHAYSGQAQIQQNEPCFPPHLFPDNSLLNKILERHNTQSFLQNLQTPVSPVPPLLPPRWRRRTRTRMQACARTPPWRP